MKAAAAILFLILACAVPLDARAQTCSASTTALAFGTYDVTLSSPTDTTATISVSCGSTISLLVGYTITLSTGSSGTYSARTMPGPNSTALSYQIYTDNGRSVVWGNGSGTTGSVSDGYLLGIGTITHSFTAYGRITARQAVSAGAFVDSVTITVTY